MNDVGQRLDLKPRLDDIIASLRERVESPRARLAVERFGVVSRVGHGIAIIDGLPGTRSDEVIRFSDGSNAIAVNIDGDEVGTVLLGEGDGLSAGAEAYQTGEVMSVPVGPNVMGRVIDPLGRPQDEGKPIQAAGARAIEQAAPAILERSPVDVPLQTGLKVVDALIPIGRGQRELILGDRHTGKTAICLDALINQRETGVKCFYCAIGKRTDDVVRVIETLREHNALDHTCVIMTTENDPPGLQYAAPYAATAMAEHFMEDGEDALIIYDDLTRHARAYRELSLLLERPPGREAFPGDIFFIHSRLLERSTHLKPELGGGSLTAVPIVETEAQNISAYIPTNIISITDGQIYLSPELFRQGNLPAVDVGKSVSRVGGKAQLKAYRKVSGKLKLSYAQFEELEAFARFETRLDESTRKSLAHGERVREILKQDQYKPQPAWKQVVALSVVSRGALDEAPVEMVLPLAAKACDIVEKEMPGLIKRINQNEALKDEDIDAVITRLQEESDHLG